MKIGNIDIGKKLILAPMAEVTDSSFRKICKELGAGLTFTQMLSAHGVINNDFDTLRFLSFSRSEKPIGVQMLGNNAEVLGEAVKEISRFKPDLIDLNCGCSVEKVVSQNLGAALLDDPKKIGLIVRKMVDSSGGIPISIKIRLGKDKTRINVLEIAKTLEDNGGSLIFIHARTRADKYDSDVDLDWLIRAKKSVNIPVVGNGSIFTPQDAKELFEKTGCDSVMIARGALGNPFLFERFNILMETGKDPGEPDAARIKEVLLKQINLIESEHGEPLCLDKVKKNTVWYFRNLPGIELLLKSIFSFTNVDSVREFIEEHAEKILTGKYPVVSNEVINKNFKKKVLFWLEEEKVEGLD
jgi:tRNA-dihydrouridine synthase B